MAIHHGYSYKTKTLQNCCCVAQCSQEQLQTAWAQDNWKCSVKFEHKLLGSSRWCGRRRSERRVILQICKQTAFKPVTRDHCIIWVIPWHSCPLPCLGIFCHQCISDALTICCPAMNRALINVRLAVESNSIVAGFNGSEGQMIPRIISKHCSCLCYITCSGRDCRSGIMIYILEDTVTHIWVRFFNLTWDHHGWINFISLISFIKVLTNRWMAERVVSMVRIAQKQLTASRLICPSFVPP